MDMGFVLFSPWIMEYESFSYSQGAIPENAGHLDTAQQSPSSCFSTVLVHLAIVMRVFQKGDSLPEG